MTLTEPRYRPADLVSFAEALLVEAGVAADRAPTIAQYLVEADLMGHTTHGLALPGPYIDELAAGRMALQGEPVVIRDTGACLTWDGRRLPGVWLTVAAIDAALERVATYGTVTVVIRRSHHIACLGAFLTRATDRGCMILLACSDPAAASVAPFGGITAVFTPDPLAVGIPTDGDPILIDTSASITTNGMSGRLHQQGRRFPHAWLQDAAGEPSDDPAVLFTDPPGTLLPAGGLDHGQKGYAMALLVEALTQGLGGFGRPSRRGLGASVFVQVIDPAAFGGDRGTSCARPAGSPTPAAGPRRRPGVERVRLPGEAALARRRSAHAEGAALYPGIMDGLAERAGLRGIAVPAPV